MLKKYESIIFDLGGVLYDIDVQRSIDAFSALGIPNFNTIYTLKNQASLIDRLEKGLIDGPGFVSSINDIMGAALDFETIKRAWNALLIGMPAENIALLKQLKAAGHKLYLLSNTNIFHFEQIDEEMKARFGLDSLAELFDHAYYSFEIGMRKPDAEIYQRVIAEQDLNPGTAVFIDDNEANVKSSIASGLPAVFKTAEISLAEILF